MILFLKSHSAESDDAIPLTEKLRRILLLKIEEEKTDQDKERAERELRKFDAPTGDHNSTGSRES